MDGIEYNTVETSTPHDLAVFKKIWKMLLDGDLKGKSWRARTLVVAATKGGIIPMNDSLRDARWLAALGKEGNPETRAVQCRMMRHAWNRQDERPFAQAVECWVEVKELPDGFKAI